MAGEFKCAWCGLTRADLQIQQPDTELPIEAALRQVIEDYGSQQDAAKHLNVSPQYVNDLLHGRRDFSETVADALGYQRIVRFVRAARTKGD